MLNQPLPTSLDIRKAAARGAIVEGTVQPSDLTRFRSLLATDEGTIQAKLAFSRDDENRFVVRVDVDANVQVMCQRCLDIMPLHLEGDNTLAIVWTDEQAVALPRHLDVLIEEEQSSSLAAIVEDELILAIKPFNYHDSDDCKKKIAAYNQPLIDEVPDEKPNPFDVLAQLKPGTGNQE